MESLLLQNSFYETGHLVGYYAAWFFTLLMVVLIIWITYKYVDTSDLN